MRKEDTHLGAAIPRQPDEVKPFSIRRDDLNRPAADRVIDKKELTDEYRDISVEEATMRLKSLLVSGEEDTRSSDLLRATTLIELHPDIPVADIQQEVIDAAFTDIIRDVDIDNIIRLSRLFMFPIENLKLSLDDPRVKAKLERAYHVVVQRGDVARFKDRVNRMLGLDIDALIPPDKQQAIVKDVEERAAEQKALFEKIQDEERENIAELRETILAPVNPDAEEK